MRAEYPDKETWKGDLATELDESLEGYPAPYLTTIKVDGRWYVSPLATVADAYVEQYNYYVREYDTGRTVDPDYDAVGLDEAPDAIVAEDPEDAIQNVVDAVADEDFAEVLAALPENQVNVLRAYVGPWKTSSLTRV